MSAFETIRAVAWEIVAVGKPGARSHFIEFYEELNDQTDKDKVLALLDAVSQHGPTAFNEKSEPLGDGIFEFRPTKQIRILWFYDETVRKRIVLTHAIRKKRDKVGSAEIKYAKELRGQYRTQHEKRR